MYESKREQREGERTIFTLRKDELEECMADMEMIYEKSVENLKTQSEFTEEERDWIRGEMVRLYDVVLVAMKIVWLQFQDKRVEVTIWQKRQR